MYKILSRLGFVAFATAQCSLVFAADFSALVVGQPISDNTVKIGQFQLQLPAGQWTVVSAMALRAGNQNGGSAVPTQLSISVARVESAKVTGLLIFRAPASSFLGVSRWNDDPCSEIKETLVKDTMKQNFRMPECFAVVKFPPSTITSATDGPMANIAQWLKDSKTNLPENLLRVYYSKYNGGDFIHANMFLPGSAENYSAAETWGRGVAQAIQKMVVRDSSIAVLPALPQ